MSNYNSRFTGEQIDEGVEKALNASGAPSATFEFVFANGSFITDVLLSKVETSNTLKTVLGRIGLFCFGSTTSIASFYNFLILNGTVYYTNLKLGASITAVKPTAITGVVKLNDVTITPTDERIVNNGDYFKIHFK